MAAFQFTPGPRDLYCRFRPSPAGSFQSPVYLGTCVVAPEPEVEQFKIPVMNDLGGRSVPFQLVQDGENASLLCTINRFDLTVARLLRSQSSGVFGDPGAGGVGTESGIARGTLVIGVSDFEFIVFNRYFNQPVAGGVVPSGLRFFSANTRKYKESTAGTRVLEVAFALDFQNVYNVQTGAFGLYTEDLSGLNLVPN